MTVARLKHRWLKFEAYNTWSGHLQAVLAGFEFLFDKRLRRFSIGVGLFGFGVVLYVRAPWGSR